MNRILEFILRLFIGRVAYAIDTYKYEEKDSGVTTRYYRISKVVIVEIFLANEVSYYVKDYTSEEEWGDSIVDVYLTKNAAARQIKRLCKL